jgi:Rrf2 family protein
MWHCLTRLLNCANILIEERSGKMPSREVAMQISSRLTVAVHTLLVIEYFKSEKVTSDFIAGSVQVNPVIIRRILLQLKRAGLIKVARGSGGTTLNKPATEITLFDVYKAVDCVDGNSMFHFHENPNKQCPVGSQIHGVLDDKLSAAQAAFEEKLAAVTLAELLKDLK